jgi:uncharacterized protein (TIGR02646 family)
VIRVQRNQRSAPAVLRGPLAAREREEAARHHRKKGHDFDRFPFRVYREAEVLERLHRLFSGKCAYCESEVGPDNPVQVEHHRPKLGALNLDGEVAPDHYWWLASEWTNLFPICVFCNRSKRTRFPIRGVRAKPETYGRKLDREKPLLLDPGIDESSEHFVFLEDGSVAPTSDRGEITIDVLALNRETLIEARQVVLWELQTQLDPAAVDALKAKPAELATTVREAMDRTRPYAAMRRQFARAWLEAPGLFDEALSASEPVLDTEISVVSLVTHADQEQARDRRGARARLKQAYSVEEDAEEHKAVYFAGKKWIEWIKIEDFKAIDRLHLTFPQPRSEREPWLTLVGENGTGKSSVLQAVALALMGERHAEEIEGLDASRFVRRDAPRRWGRVQVKLATIPEPIAVHFSRSSPKFKFKTAEPKVLLLAYGATRLLRQRVSPTASAPTYVRIQNLFDPTAPLSDVESWLVDRRAVDAKRFKTVTAALTDLLMLGPHDRFVRQKDRVEVVLRDECPVGLRQLSDGFQSVVSLAADIMKSLLERFPTMQEAEGIVLVDELDAHLHPAWKIQIVERLRRTFPRVSFMVSTHDPLCLKGLYEGEIVVLRRDGRNHISSIVDVPPVNDLRADQILTSPLFGLASTRGDEASFAIARYSDLRSRPDLAPADARELKRLQGRLEQTLTNRESPSQREVERKLWRALGETAPAAVDALAAQAPEQASTTEELELRRQLDDLLGVKR